MSDQLGFNFTEAISHVCDDMIRRLPEFSHIDMSRVAVSFTQAKKNVPYGIQASLTPLRFENGSCHTKRSGRLYTCQKLLSPFGIEFYYILSFYLPRFLNHSLEEKLSTIIHELWHISPAFDGDIRRYAGRCYAHGSSHKEYDRQMTGMAQRWLLLDPPSHLYEFLNFTFEELRAEHGRVFGQHYPTPKLIRQEAA